MTNDQSDRFDRCRRLVLSNEKIGYGIGILSEKNTHNILKQYFSSHVSEQEYKIGSFYADVYTGDHIYEVQTRGFFKLKRKLEYFLQTTPVTVVYPLSRYNTIHWINEKDGTTAVARKMKHPGGIYNIFTELYGIRPLLSNENLSFKIMYMDTDEYRLYKLNSRGKKCRVGNSEKDPTSLVEEYDIASKNDYLLFLPLTLPEQFLSKDLAKEAHISNSLANVTLLILTDLGVVNRIGKKGNAYIYTVALD